MLIGPESQLEPPNEVFRKRPVIVERGLFQNPSDSDPNVLQSATRLLHNETPDEPTEPLALQELSVNNLRDGADTDQEEYLRRLREIARPGQRVLLTRLRHSYNLTNYLRRYSQEPLRFAMGMSTLTMLFADEYYTELPGGLLEAAGRLFANNVKIYAHDMPVEAFNAHLAAADISTEFVSVADGDRATMTTIEFEPPLGLLFDYVTEAGWIVSLNDQAGVTSS